jgi:hypothetical protein
MANDALKGAPDQFLTVLKEGLTECRAMVWSIIQNKRFDGFSDVDNLVSAYDHLNKTLQIFSKFQLPLPGMSEEEAKDEKAKKPALPLP